MQFVLRLGINPNLEGKEVSDESSTGTAGAQDRRGRYPNRLRNIGPSLLRTGLISSQRNGSGYRIYRTDVVRRVSFLRTAQRVGLTLDEIGEARNPHRRSNSKPPETGPGSHSPGDQASTSESMSSPASWTGSTAVPAVAASRWTPAASGAPTTQPQPSDRAPAT